MCTQLSSPHPLIHFCAISAPFLILYRYRFRNIIFVLFLFRWTRKAFYQLKGRGIGGSIVDVYNSTCRTLYGIFLRLPGVRTKVQTQIAESLLKLERRLVPSGPGVERTLTLPQEGWSDDQVKAALEKLAEMEHTRWEDGRVSGAVYHGGDELLRLQTEAFGKFTVSNPIHPDVFPGVRKMEAEIVAMVNWPSVLIYNILTLIL